MGKCLYKTFIICLRNFIYCIYLGEGRGVLMHVYVWEHIVSLSYRTDWWMLTKLGRDEVDMALRMPLGFSARSAQRWIKGGGGPKKIGQWGAPSLKDFFFRSECNSKKTNASLYPELKYRECLMFRLISQIWQSCFLINHLLRNLTFNRSAHCTQVSDQCPLGLLLQMFGPAAFIKQKSWWHCTSYMIFIFNLQWLQR